MKYNYHIDVEGKKVVCLTRYAGRVVRGIAKCNPEYDEFNIETGKQLAKLRCEAKVAAKRAKTCKRRFEEATIMYVAAKKNELRSRVAYKESLNDINAANKALADFENKLNNP